MGCEVRKDFCRGEEDKMDSESENDTEITEEQAENNEVSSAD